MKTLFFLLLIGAVSPTLAAYKPTGTVPAAVTSSFEKRYPDALVKKWMPVSLNDYAVRFKLHDVKYTAVFQTNGKWEKTVRIYAPTHRIPDGVRQGFRHSGYEGCNIDGIKEVITPEGSTYVIAVDDGNYYDSDHHDVFTTDYLLTFTADGKMIGAHRAEFRDSAGL
ncbi:PepSY-like domain-containing protein [Dinghuibacter silviterrae]|uniref:Putative PepSY-like beta-lactamase-inhibitor n=1 Tax=Dinghuibacter silviterrae TaxID=1539049 RepID=A0A4R8DH72_9BACT|nr:PepSY-like domain-containing protein [Dinghuibacter silviterrae]TDW96456.1 putative PepSY-like beta-lactamase-inhibitor [Dinghuibacter silviterrae]